MKNMMDLKKAYEDSEYNKKQSFENFCRFIQNNPKMIHTGNLAEMYCGLLFDINLCEQGNNKGFDGTEKNNPNIKVEIKCRKKIGSSMTINFDEITYILYVELNEETLLPKKIFKFSKENLNYYIVGKNRVHFNKAIKGGNSEPVFQ